MSTTGQTPRNAKHREHDSPAKNATHRGMIFLLGRRVAIDKSQKNTGTAKRMAPNRSVTWCAAAAAHAMATPFSNAMTSPFSIQM